MQVAADRKITRCTYRGWPAVALESAECVVTIVPALGGKIASLVDRRTRREFLVQPQASPLCEPARNAKFVASDPFGFDDMFPTILEWRGATDQGCALIMPDHGEVWSRRWTETEISEDALTLSIDCESVPCRLTKRCTMRDTRTLRVDYVAQNRSDESFPALWAAHPLIACPDAVTIDLPPGDVISAHNGSRDYGDHGTRSRWTTRTLEPAKFGQPPSAHKFYAAQPNQVRTAEFRFPQTNERIGLNIESAAPIYFGLWHEERENGTRVLAPEHCTGGFDRPDLARQHGQPCHFGPREEKRWTLTLDIHPYPKY
jgi:Galactose mutarotase and related enzymes